MTGAAGRAQSSHEAPSREGDLRLAEHSDTAPSAISHDRQEAGGERGPGTRLSIWDRIIRPSGSVRQRTAGRPDVADTATSTRGELTRCQSLYAVRGLAVCEQPAAHPALFAASLDSRPSRGSWWSVPRRSRHPFTDSSATIDRSAEGKCQIVKMPATKSQ